MEKTKTNDGMKYIGDGTSLFGVPTRDLTDSEVLKYGKEKLLASGLYELTRVYMPKPTKSALKGYDIGEQNGRN